MTTPRAVLLVAALAVVARLPFLTVLPSPDEAGLLIVGGQWHDGASLYGDYWVDRPPLLMGLAELAAHTGGVVAFRVLGLVAVVVTVVACAATAGRLAGDRAARWAAVAAAVLTVSPWLGADRVNAELLATPWIAVAVYAAVRTVEAGSLRWAALTGATAMAAVLTKQNHADAAVFALVLLIASVVTGAIPRRRAVAIVGVTAAGAAAVTILLFGWAWLRGTPPTDLADALFGFRLRADEAMTADRPDTVDARRWELLGRSLVSGQLILLAATVLAPVRRSLRAPVWWGLSAMALFGCASILAGGSWWNHYLVELAVPLAVASGLLAARTRHVLPAVLAYGLASALVGTVLVRSAVNVADGRVTAGRMIESVAEPGDTALNAWGRPDVLWAAGLTSPYEHLWSLPARTDDPQLIEFSTVVSGPRAPTWIVSLPTLVAWGMHTQDAQALVDRRYRTVATVCGYDIRLLKGVDRPAPETPDDFTCEKSSRLR